MLEIVASVVIGLPVALMPLVLGIFILTYGNRRMREQRFNPIFVLKANIAGLMAVGLGCTFLAAGAFGVYQKLTNPQRKVVFRPIAPAPPVTATPAVEVERSPFPDRPGPQGFDDVKQGLKPLDGHAEEFAAAREQLRSAREQMKMEQESAPPVDTALPPLAPPARQSMPVGPRGRPAEATAPIERGQLAPPARFERPARPTSPARGGAAQEPPPVPVLEPKTEAYLRELEASASEILTRDEHRLIRDFTVGGTKFTHGLYVHPPEANQASRVAYSLGKSYAQLRGAVGQSDGLPPRSQSRLTFRLIGDGRELWRSGDIQQHGEWEAFQVNIRGVDRLELITDCPGPHTHAWAVWIDPVLSK